MAGCSQTAVRIHALLTWDPSQNMTWYHFLQPHELSFLRCTIINSSVCTVLYEEIFPSYYILNGEAYP